MSKDITNNFSVLNADLPESVDNALKNLGQSFFSWD